MIHRSMFTLAVIGRFLLTPHAALAQDLSDVPTCATTRDAAARLWCQGAAKWEGHDYEGAIPYFSRALDLQKRHPTLSRTTWRILVDNLGMAYGMGGDLKKAREIFEYGLAADSSYPMFYYLLADDYAEGGDEALTIEYLNRAFAHRANMNAGETLPDPRTDDSFQRFMHDSKFLAALRALPRD